MLKIEVNFAKQHVLDWCYRGVNYIRKHDKVHNFESCFEHFFS